MDSLQYTTHSTTMMKEKTLVVAEQYKDIYTAPQNWVNLVKQREQMVEELQERINKMQVEADLLMDPDLREAKKKDVGWWRVLDRLFQASKDVQGQLC